VRFAATRLQEIEVAIHSSDEAVEAGADKNRRLQGESPLVGVPAEWASRAMTSSI